MEMGMCQFIIMGVVQGEYDPKNTMLWRDWLYPFPMEGAAVVVIALVLYPFFIWLKKKFTGKKRILAYVISFIAGALLCTVIEFSMGLIVNDHYQLWDYRENFCNIMGQVCLQNTMAFGVVAAIITWWVYPMLERWIARVPRDIMNIAAVVIIVFGAIIWSLYLINPPGVDDANLPQNKDDPELVQKQYDTRMVASKLALVESDLNELERTIDATKQLDKEALKADVEKLRANARSMLKDSLGLEEYPDVYDRFLGALSANRLLEQQQKQQQQQ
jgi:predicted PurR-regulated permease PerM